MLSFEKKKKSVFTSYAAGSIGKTDSVEKRVLKCS